MKRIVCFGLALCVVLLGFAYAEGNSTCVCLTEFLPETVPDLICSTYKIDASAAMDVLMKAPYLTVDTKGHYKGTGWLNGDEEMAIGPDYVTYETRLGRNLANLVEGLPPSFTEWNGGAANDLSFGGVDKIAALAKDVLNRLNLHVELIHAQAYDEAALRAAIPSAFRPVDARKIEECYALFFCCVENGLRIPANGYHSDMHGTYMQGSEIMTLWTKDGLQLLSASGLYRIDERVENGERLLSPEEALSIVQEEYAMYVASIAHPQLIGVNISHQRLVYAKVPISGVDPESGYRLTPAWLFTQDQQWNVSMEAGGYEVGHFYSDLVLIDARTGEEL